METLSHMWCEGDIGNLLKVVVEELCGDWKSWYKTHIEYVGFDLNKEQEEFDEWREQYAQDCVENEYVGKFIKHAIKEVFGTSYDKLDLWELHLDIEKKLKSEYDGWYGDLRNYTPDDAFNCMIQDYLKENQDKITLTELATWNCTYNCDNSYNSDNTIKEACEKYMDFENYEYMNMEESLKNSVKITADVNEYDTSDKDEAEEYLLKYYLPRYNDTIEAPLIKFQASCRRITEIWRYVRTMNELCSRGCGNWR